MKELAHKLNLLLSQDYEYWKQRSRVLWLSEGDRNTKFFHCQASMRHKKNHITGLFDSEGVWQETNEGIGDVVFDYFTKMFSAGTYDVDHMRDVVDLILSAVTRDMNIELCAPYHADEIKVALY